MPNHIVVKKDGKFEIVPSDADVALANAQKDKDKIKNKLTDVETRALLMNILVRLEALESSSW